MTATARQKRPEELPSSVWLHRNLFHKTPDRISWKIENVQISNLRSPISHLSVINIFALWFALTRIRCDDGYCWRLAFLDGRFNYKTVGKKSCTQLQLDVSSAAIATTMQHISSPSCSHTRKFNREKTREEDDLAAAAIQLSLIILRLSHTQFEHSEKVKSNFNNYIITLWASSTPAEYIIVIIVARVRGEPSFENHARPMDEKRHYNWWALNALKGIKNGLRE